MTGGWDFAALEFNGGVKSWPLTRWSEPKDKSKPALLFSFQSEPNLSSSLQREPHGDSRIIVIDVVGVDSPSAYLDPTFTSIPSHFIFNVRHVTDAYRRINPNNGCETSNLGYVCSLGFTDRRFVNVQRFDFSLRTARLLWLRVTTYTEVDIAIPREKDIRSARLVMIPTVFDDLWHEILTKLSMCLLEWKSRSLSVTSSIPVAI